MNEQWRIEYYFRNWSHYWDEYKGKVYGFNYDGTTVTGNSTGKTFEEIDFHGHFRGMQIISEDGKEYWLNPDCVRPVLENNEQ